MFLLQWMVLFVEVRPNMLSGESERFLLEDVSQVNYLYADSCAPLFLLVQ